jgi:hypothetical protein
VDPRSLRRALVAPIAFLALVPGHALASNPADRLAGQPIDSYSYDWSKSCNRHRRPQRGTLALQHWLERHARGASWGIMRCERMGGGNYSLHSEGRALDWHLDVANPRDRAAAGRLVRLLLARDRAGNNHALARRMGIQEIIWDCHGWFSGDGGMLPYSVCYDANGHRKRHVDPTLGHRNHIHFGLNWAGARMRTSFWRFGLR